MVYLAYFITFTDGLCKIAIDFLPYPLFWMYFYIYLPTIVTFITFLSPLFIHVNNTFLQNLFKELITNQYKMTTIILLYVVDSTVTPSLPPERNFPSLHFQDKARYPLMWMGTTTSVNTESVIYDKRSTYIKFKNQKRYYSEYMELFKFIDSNDYIPTHLKVCLKIIETEIPTKELVQDRLMHHLFFYRFYHGDRLILNTHYRFLIEEHLKLFEERVPEATCVTDDQRRARLNAKSKRYYARNKEAIKARRDERKHASVPAEPVVMQ